MGSLKYTHVHFLQGQERIARRMSLTINEYAYHPHQHQLQKQYCCNEDLHILLQCLMRVATN